MYRPRYVWIGSGWCPLAKFHFRLNSPASHLRPGRSETAQRAARLTPRLRSTVRKGIWPECANARAARHPPEVGHVRYPAIAWRSELAAAGVRGADRRHPALYLFAPLAVALWPVGSASIPRNRDRRVDQRDHPDLQRRFGSCPDDRLAAPANAASARDHRGRRRLDG